jgi:hypothetical protein
MKWSWPLRYAHCRLLTSPVAQYMHDAAKSPAAATHHAVFASCTAVAPALLWLSVPQTGDRLHFNLLLPPQPGSWYLMRGYYGGLLGSKSRLRQIGYPEA